MVCVPPGYVCVHLCPRFRRRRRRPLLCVLSHSTCRLLINFPHAVFERRICFVPIRCLRHGVHSLPIVLCL